MACPCSTNKTIRREGMPWVVAHKHKYLAHGRRMEVSTDDMSPVLVNSPLAPRADQY